MTPPLRGSDFLLILRTQNGKQYVDRPLREYRDSLGAVFGFDFQQGESVDILFAKTYAAPDVMMNVQFEHDFILYHTPLLGFSRIPQEILSNDVPPVFQERFHMVTSEMVD